MWAEGQTWAQLEVFLILSWLGVQRKHSGNIAVFMILPYPNVACTITHFIVKKKLVDLKILSYKILLRGISKGYTKWRGIPYAWMARLNMVKNLVLCKLICRFSVYNPNHNLNRRVRTCLSVCCVCVCEREYNLENRL